MAGVNLVYSNELSLAEYGRYLEEPCTGRWEFRSTYFKTKRLDVKIPEDRGKFQVFAIQHCNVATLIAATVVDDNAQPQRRRATSSLEMNQQRGSRIQTARSRVYSILMGILFV
ncbi:unnamed protein product [Fusarium graminearum]|nr:unnamed protein product [Fusarium graminearum]CAF3595765.1 unnamed protein product [Fusarium graminearum]CAG2012476.1 unnamed protein product [Fusarium graminearum]